MRKRMRAKLKAIKSELKRRQHTPLPTQGQWLRGRHGAIPILWRAAQRPTAMRVPVSGDLPLEAGTERRSQAAYITWQRIYRIAERWLPNAKICHPYPTQRCASRLEASAGCGSAARPDLCGGAARKGRPYRDWSSRPLSMGCEARARRFEPTAAQAMAFALGAAQLTRGT
jgi:hypothetical protein